MDHVWIKVGLGFGSYDDAMSMQEPPTRRAVRPLLPVYPFNEPGQPVALHDGLVEGLAPDDASGVVQLSFTPDPRVIWRSEDRVEAVAGDSVTLVLRKPDGDAPVTGIWRSSHDGWSNGAVVGKATCRSSGSSCTGSTFQISMARLCSPGPPRPVSTGGWADGKRRRLDGSSPLTSDPTILGSGGISRRPTSM